MSLKKVVQIALLAVIAIGSFTYAIKKMQLVHALNIRIPNIFVVSFCSLKSDSLLTQYGGEDATLMPNLERFVRESNFVFDNVINGLSWTALFGYVRLGIEQSFISGAGYAMPGLSEERLLLRVPLKRSWSRQTPDQIIDDSDFEKDIVPTLELLERMIKNLGEQPFFLITHIKYMHYPLIDRFNADSGWDYFLNADERALINEYLMHPDKYYQKLPFLLLLANNPRHALEHPRVKKMNLPSSDKSLQRLRGLMTNAEYLADWKASEGYADDLRLLEKIYRGNARFLDKKIEPVLNLYGDKKLQENTIMFFAGDHGEMHMERDELTHGLGFWDQVLKVPFSAKFPGSRRHEVIKEQVNFQTITKVLHEMIAGKNSAEDFKKNLTAFRDDVVLGKDCNNTLRGLRYKNKYKYFATLGNSERFLFDLEKDPEELHNLAGDQPGVVSEMESLYWKNFDRFSTSSDPYRSCAPWVYTASGAD